MTVRHQALHSREPLAAYFFFSLILAFLLTLPSIFARAQDAQPGKVALVHPGDMNTKAWTAGLKIADATDGGGVAKLWARSKIASLEAKVYTDPNAKGIDKAIETVALAHHLVSSQMSLVAIDKVSRDRTAKACRASTCR